MIRIALLCGICLSLTPLLTADEGKAKAPKGPASAKSAPKNSAEPETKGPQYIRIRRDERRLPVAMETPVITFRSSDKFKGVTVDLVGAVHLGEGSYYKELNNRFRNYDMVLFEAVMPEDAVKNDARPGGGGAGRAALPDEEEWDDAKVGFAAISVLQLGMKDALGMEFQLAAVDYTPKNFVHADMTAEEFEESMKNRGESFGGMLLSEMGKSMSSSKQQNPLAMNLDLVLSALSSDRVYAVRRIAANQLAQEGTGESFAGRRWHVHHHHRTQPPLPRNHGTTDQRQKALESRHLLRSWSLCRYGKTHGQRLRLLPIRRRLDRRMESQKSKCVEISAKKAIAGQASAGQPSAISHQPSVVSRQPSAVCRLPSAVCWPEIRRQRNNSH
ncbi:MAG UNVERIFIED_CONTAM: hypothetical protein LVR18_36130 [Planctomycetaceae bacterium]|jgi:hypothetical protein